MEAIESFVNCSAQVLIIGFTLVMMLDFISGAIHLFNSSAPTPTIAHSELETQSAMPQGYALMSITPEPKPKQEPQPQPLSLVTAGRDVVEPVDSEPATLDWLSTAQAMTADDTTTDQPNIINMARARQQHPVFGSESDMDYNRLSIRELKKLASSRKIKRYNVMTKNQLIDQLAALDQLTA